ncbi:MAG: M24 family metallopeptidase [Nitrososphaerales archaeon]
MSEYDSRLEKIRKAMEEKNVDSLVIFGNGYDAGDLVYVGNYIPFGRAAIILGKEGEPTMLTDAFLHGEPINSYIYTTWIRDLIPVHHDPKEFASELLNEVEKNNPKTVGVVGMDNLPMTIWNEISSVGADKKFQWRDFWFDFSSVKSVRSSAEISLLREVGGITSKAMQEAVEATLEHKTEQEIAGIASKAMFDYGAHDRAFQTIVNGGPRGGLKHTFPSKRKIQDGDLVDLDLGAMKYGYQSDMSRSVVVGKANEDQKLVLNTVLKAYRTLSAMLRPGVRTSEILKRSIELEEESGLREKFHERIYLGFFVHHAIASSFHGFPSSGFPDTVLKAGMSFAFEPMAHILDFGTAVIEDDVLMTNDGVESLTPYALINWK